METFNALDRAESPLPERESLRSHTRPVPARTKPRPRGRRDSHPPAPPMRNRAIIARLKKVCAERHYTVSAVAQGTGFNSESVRRWIRGFCAPQAEFLGPFCKWAAINPAWLVMGEGPMETTETQEAALQSATPEALLEALSLKLKQDASGRLILPSSFEGRIVTPVTYQSGANQRSDQKPSDPAPRGH